MHFKIDRASLIVGSKFTVFALFYFVFDGNFPSASSGGEGGGGLHLERRFTGGFLGYPFGGLYMEGLIFRNLRYSFNIVSEKICCLGSPLIVY